MSPAAAARPIDESVDRIASYRALLRVPQFGRLAAATLLVRGAASMWQLALVLLVLLRYQSSVLAGLAVFLSIFPGIVVSPLAGALLDRYGRIRLMIVDYVTSAAALAAIVAAAALSAPLPLLLAFVVVGSLTNPLGAAGSRSLFPLLVPKHLWDRANAVDSIGYMATTMVGPPLAGAIIALSSPDVAIGVTAILFLVAAVTLAGVRDASPAVVTGRLVDDARAGVVYVLRNPTLRSLAASMSLNAGGHGILIVALPVLVLRNGYGGPSTIGLLWALMGGVGIASGLLAGRLGTEGRERPMLIAALVVTGAGFGVAATAVSLAPVVAGIVLVGSGGAVADVAMFSLRQRVTDHAWFGRAFAVSMHLNYSGVPIGSAIAGPLLAISAPAALATALGFSLVAALITRVTMPPTSRR